MGGSCCVFRKDDQSSNESSDNNKGQSQDYEKKGLALAFIKANEDKCEGKGDKQTLLTELSMKYAYKHKCCYFESQYLQSRFGLIELQSVGYEFDAGIGVVLAFQSEINYLYQDLGVINKDTYSVIVLLIFKESIHPFSLKRMKGSPEFVIHDIFPVKKSSSMKEAREVYFQSENQFHQYLITLSLQHLSQDTSQTTQKIQLLTFIEVDKDQSMSSEESPHSNQFRAVNQKLPPIPDISLSNETTNISDLHIALNSSPEKEIIHTVNNTLA